MRAEDKMAAGKIAALYIGNLKAALYLRMLSEIININTQATHWLFLWRHSVFFAFSLEKRLNINLNGYEQAHLKGITSKN